MSDRRTFLRHMSILGAFPFVNSTTLKVWRQSGGDSFDEKAYGNLIEPPDDPADWPAFRKAIQEWRIAKRKELAYTGDTYDEPAYHWAALNYSCCFLMMYDLNFYDREKRVYTVDRIIERGVKEFGGYDSVVLWHAYPRIGIDERNQFDFYRDMPGGLAGIKKLSDAFHSKGIRVFINYNPWDTGTGRESKSDIDTLVEIVAAIDADGIFLDTMKKAGENFRAKLDAVKPGVVLEGELAAELEILPTHHLSWAQEFKDRYVPAILRNKWYERRHIQHQIARWNRDHSSELQQAWMNGSGMMVWENVFGQWIAWSERDKSILRTMLPIQRRFHKHFISEDWTPLVETKMSGIFAGRWQADKIKLWTLVNRNEREITGVLLELPHTKGDIYFDLIKGEAVTPAVTNGSALLKGTIGPRSIGCFIACKKEDAGNDLPAFLAIMKAVKKNFNGDTGFPKMTPVSKKLPAVRLSATIGEQMAEIRPVTINQRYEFVLRECGTYTSYPELSMYQLDETLTFERMTHIPHMAMDITPVTNSQYAAFIKATGYQPPEPYQFLKHWQNGNPPAGKEDHPVVYVDLDDARAYAHWAGKRLPTESEWQFAAQGFDQRRYPWGHELKDNYYNKSGDTTPVAAFPEGKSPFGCMDMCSNTWELTESEHADRHNRFCILKGGSYFEAKGSMWYTPGGPQPSSIVTKFLMLYPGLDRCSTIGFRCVKGIR